MTPIPRSGPVAARRLRACVLLVVALLALALPRPATAQTTRDEARFDLVMAGLTAGTLTFAAETDGRSYAVRGRLASSGILSFVRKVSYDATARGRVRDGAYLPARYTERADTGRRQSEAEILWRGGVPQVASYTPPRDPRPTDVDPATQAGSVDILTALYATLRDADAGRECNRSFSMYDGRRASRLSLGTPEPAEGGVTCAGEYRRVAGFPPEDMAEKTRFPFTLTYAPAPDGRMRVTEVRMDTLYGSARLIRR